MDHTVGLYLKLFPIMILRARYRIRFLSLLFYFSSPSYSTMDFPATRISSLVVNDRKLVYKIFYLVFRIYRTLIIVHSSFFSIYCLTEGIYDTGLIPFQTFQNAWHAKLKNGTVMGKSNSNCIIT